MKLPAGCLFGLATIGLLFTLPINLCAQTATESGANDSQTAMRPNIIVVLVDDMGIGDLTPTNRNCQLRTPNLQQLADQGLTFLDAHSSSSVCTPTRYGLLTGRYNWRSRLANGVLNGESPHLIPADRATIGHLLQRAGYHTAMLGKWHLGWDWARADGKIDFAQPVENGPNINGFDHYYAFSGSLDMPPYVWVENGRVTALPDREEGVTKQQDPYGWYRPGPVGADFKVEQVLPHLFDKAIAHVGQRAQEQKPFMLYLALPAPHTPILPLPPFKDASGINPYADFVMQIDHHMGQLMTAIRDAEIESNTLVIFTSDNGCSPEANFDELAKHQHDPSAGYRGHKADLFEGGHRVPLIVRWPERMEGGKQTNAVVCLTDLYATLESIIGEPDPGSGGEDGFSWLPLFEGRDSTGRETLISHSVNGAFAIREGDWKLLLSAGSGGWSRPTDAQARQQQLPKLQLYNLRDDPAETNNLANQQPQLVANLLLRLDREVQQGRSTPGDPLNNDRQVRFLPDGIELPKTEESGSLQ